MDLTYRPGTLEDIEAAYEVFVQTTIDLERRMGTPDSEIIWIDPLFTVDYWDRRKSLFEHLTRTAEHFWIAEDRGQVIGYARTTLHDGLRELIDYYVLPDYQSKGIGGELLRRAFPSEGARLRAIIASTDIRALVRYLKAGVYPRFAIYYIFGKPEPVEIETDLEFKAAPAASETLEMFRVIDKAILGFARQHDHEFLLKDRPAFLFFRGDNPVGYGYFGDGVGPIALLDEADFPAVLARAETEAAARNEQNFGINLPLINRAALDYLLRRGFRLEDFTVLFMSDKPFGKFENYIFSNPPFFM